MELTLRFAGRNDVKPLKITDPEYKLAGKRLQDCVPIIIAEVEKSIVGYIVYDIDIDGYFLDHVFVVPKYRMQSIARFLVNCVLSKINTENRTSVLCQIPEKDSKRGLDKIKFCRKLGFTLIGYDEDDALLVYDLPRAAIHRIQLSDRMAEWFPESLPFEIEEN